MNILNHSEHQEQDEAVSGAGAHARAGDTPTLTKAELAELLFEQLGLNKREAKDMVEAFFDVIRESLEKSDGVKLSGFGNFQLRDKPQRPGRNPKTGEVIPIAARRVVTFHASQKLKALVDGTEEGGEDGDRGFGGHAGGFAAG
ncbi:MAG: integration host factor subunit alpha [Candidatus Protistobacter heckmanni]|nr:integration host factor subunit alpha [Candidatus Protistobacter heckmanni]